MKSSNYTEEKLHTYNAWIFIFFLITVAALSILNFLYKNNPEALYILIIIFFMISFISKGFFILKPNQSLVATLFGKYVGSQTEEGFYWNNPFNQKIIISTKVNNFSTTKLKVNDKNGNPIEIASVFVWKVEDSAKACFSVEKYEKFLETQCETAVRKVAAHYPYDSNNEDTITLKNNKEEIAKMLKDSLTKNISFAGIEIIDANLTHLAYSPEIAQAMLKKQQAQAIISARKQLVEGAVEMVEEAITSIENKKLAVFDNNQKVNIISNLLTVLVSDTDTTPVVQLNKND